MAYLFVDISFFNTIYPHGLLVSDVTLFLLFFLSIRHLLLFFLM